MDNINDRYNLVLLELKEYKSLIAKRKIQRLEKKYPDNATYRGTIIKELSKRGLVEYANSEATQNENGSLVYENDLPKFYRTNGNGKLALSNRLFPSESRQKTMEKLFRSIQIIGISIAAIGGLITIISFICNQIKCFLN
jgi:hypothetical protein